MRIRFIRAGIISIVATVMLAVITLAIIGTSAFGDSADLSYRTLDYDVTATANGDLKVTQHIDVKSVPTVTTTPSRGSSCSSNTR